MGRTSLLYCLAFALIAGCAHPPPSGDAAHPQDATTYDDRPASDEDLATEERADGAGSDLGASDLVMDLAALDRGAGDLAAPDRSDLSAPDLAVPDLVIRDLAIRDLALPDLVTPDLAIPDIAASDLSLVADLGKSPPDATSDLSQPNDAAPDAAPTCLPQKTADLRDLILAAPYASANGVAKMGQFARGSPKWKAAHDAALAWAAGDCPAFLAAAQQIGYVASDVKDAPTGRRHWVLTDGSGAYNGVFALRAPDERGGARKLVIDSPHWGYDFSDDRAVIAYRALDAVALLQNSAHRCNLNVCSNCSAVNNYACGGCTLVSDVVHSTDQLYFAIYDGLEQARDDLHFEYHGAGQSNNVMGCVGTAHISQASSVKLTAVADDGTWPNLFWRAMEKRLGDGCACYHQRETGCLLNGAASTCGRRTNTEAAMPADECTVGSAAVAARFVHFEGYNIPVATVIAAIAEAIP